MKKMTLKWFGLALLVSFVPSVMAADSRLMAEFRWGFGATTSTWDATLFTATLASPSYSDGVGQASSHNPDFRLNLAQLSKRQNSIVISAMGQPVSQYVVGQGFVALNSNNAGATANKSWWSKHWWVVATGGVIVALAAGAGGSSGNDDNREGGTGCFDDDTVFGDQCVQ